ncbi:hypothetical protein JCM3774_006495 [Rhodotorula dairenensis]
MPSPRKRSASPVNQIHIPARQLLASHPIRMSYRIGRSEQGVLTFEPYKSHLLPLWRFKTPDIARESAQKIEREFQQFEHQRDFVGCDMARKFLQMGMTRSTRYANRAGGRKYDEAGALLPKTSDHPGAAAKLESANIFREAWERVKQREEYKQLRTEWELEKKRWEKAGRPGLKEEEEEEEEPQVDAGSSTKLSIGRVDPASLHDTPTKGRRRSTIKNESSESGDESRPQLADAESPPRTRSASKRKGDPDGGPPFAAKRRRRADGKVNREVKQET